MIRVKRLWLTYAAFALTTAAMVIAAPCEVASQSTLSVAPMLIELASAPGSARTFDVTIRNEGYRSAVDLSVYVADIAQNSRGEYVVMSAGVTPYSCAKWMELSADKIRLEPGAGAGVSGRVTVPRGATGGRYAAIVFEQAPTVPDAQEAMGMTQVVQQFLVLVELTVTAPSTRKALSIASFTALPAAAAAELAQAYGGQALVLSAEVRNDGNVHALARGTMILRDAAGKRLRQIQLGAGRGLILPGAGVNLVSVLTAGLPPGDYQVDISINYGGIRPATAKAAFTVGDEAAGATALDHTTSIGSFLVNPTELDLVYPAGATVSRSFTVENRSDQTIKVEPRAVPLAFDEAGELVVTEGDASPDHSCAGWIAFRPATIELKPGAKQIQRMTISIPKGEAGSSYANLLFTATPVGEGEPWSGEAGALVFLRVGDAVVTSATLSPITIEDGGPSVGMVFGTVFENTGSVHVKPRATISLQRRVMPVDSTALGKDVQYVGPGSLEEVATLALEEEKNVVLPGSRRDIYIAFSGMLEPGDYVVEFVVHYGATAPTFVRREFTVPQSEEAEP